MITLIFLAALGAPGDPAPGQDGPEAASSGIEPYLTLRSGIWASTGFHFEAVTNSLRREIDTNALFSVGLDGGVEVADRFVFFATYEANMAEDIFADVAGACVGYREHGEEQGNPAVPVSTTIYAGGIWGRFDVDEEGYEFDDAFGFRAGIAFSWKAGRRWAVDLVGEYRLIEFKCETKPDSGDKEVGGSTLWAGLGLSYRF